MLLQYIKFNLQNIFNLRQVEHKQTICVSCFIASSALNAEVVLHLKLKSKTVTLSS